MSCIVSRTQILRLYKDLIRYSNRLEFTDRDYYLKRARQEYRKNQHLEKQEDIEFFFEKGQAFLKNSRLI